MATARLGGPTKRSAEWVCGRFPFPGVIHGDEGRIEMDVVVWLTTDGAVLGHLEAEPEGILGLVAESLQKVIERPLVGVPHAPKRVRVATEELAAAVQAADPAIEVMCAPTPEVDHVRDAMRRKLGDDDDEAEAGDEGGSYLSEGVDARAVGAFFEAAAGLFRVAPWDVVPDFQCLFAVSAPALDVFDLAVAVSAPSEGSRGAIYLFASIEDYDAHLSRAPDDPLSPLLTLAFGSPDALTETMRDEIVEHGWELAAPDSVPELVVIDEAGTRGATAGEYALVEAIARALPALFEDRRALLRAWDVAAPVTRTCMVPTHAGPVEITITAPYEDVSQGDLPDDLLGALAALEDEGELDHGARSELETAILRRMIRAPEGAEIDSVRSCRVVLDAAADHLGATIATLSAEDLREVLFEIVPRQVTIDPSAAAAIVAETRALYMFLDREMALEQAPACLGVLGGAAEKNLAAALADTSRFGMAKQMVAEARRAGHDMSSPEAVMAWMREIESRPLPASIRPPGDPAARAPLDPKAKKAKKDGRKAARKARKKNR